MAADGVLDDTNPRMPAERVIKSGLSATQDVVFIPRRDAEALAHYMSDMQRMLDTVRAVITPVNTDDDVSTYSAGEAVARDLLSALVPPVQANATADWDDLLDSVGGAVGANIAAAGPSELSLNMAELDFSQITAEQARQLQNALTQAISAPPLINHLVGPGTG